MMKRFHILLVVITMAALLFLTGCNGKAAKTPAPAPENVSWSGYFGTLVRQDSSQYNNAALQVKGLDDRVVLFAIDMMEGSESEERANSLQIAGTMLVEDNGSGLYECLQEDGSTAYSIRFDRSEDGQQITVTHTGDIPMNPDGNYDWVDFRIESDAGLAVALLENLPTAATSLNSNSGAYTINYPEESVLNYFYPVTATFDDTGAVLAEYLVCADLSAVWRLDTEDGIPALIYGTAQDMLDKVVYLEPESDPGDNGAEYGSAEPGAMPLLGVVIEGGTLMAPGASAKIGLNSPYPFACSLDQPLSANEAVATVSKDGTVTAHSPGTTTITADIVVADGKRGFMLEITVGTEGEAAAAKADGEKPVD
ncbi:MAG TPA: Ig-like domain-containing protein [Syntrophomonas sp.]|nr:Ig-like domain-containing protein [Syntrophomonas sp.]